MYPLGLCRCERLAEDRWCILFFGAIDGLCPWIGRVLWLFGYGVDEAVEYLSDIVGHVKVYGAPRIVPSKADTTEDTAVPVNDCLVYLVKVGDEVNGVLSAGLLNTKIVDNEVKHEGAEVVLEQAGCETSGDISAKF